MDPKTKNLLPNLLCLKTLAEREIFFREMLAEFLCGLYFYDAVGRVNEELTNYDITDNRRSVTDGGICQHR